MKRTPGVHCITTLLLTAGMGFATALGLEDGSILSHAELWISSPAYSSLARYLALGEQKRGSRADLRDGTNSVKEYRKC